MVTPTDPCQDFQEFYFHYQYGSDQEEIVTRLGSHLSLCVTCTVFYENELLLTEVLTKRIKRVKWEEPPLQLLSKLEALRDHS